MSTPIQLAVHGAGGRMGQRVIALAADDPDFKIVAAIDHDEHRSLGKDAGSVAGTALLNVLLSGDWPKSAGVVIDFSLPSAMDACVANCVQADIPLVLATTGLNEKQKASLAEAAKQIPFVWAPSMSMAVNLTMKLAQQITETLKDVAGGIDIEILERHHRYKADAPSGTALRFGELIAEKLDEARQTRPWPRRRNRPTQPQRNRVPRDSCWRQSRRAHDRVRYVGRTNRNQCRRQQSRLLRIGRAGCGEMAARKTKRLVQHV